MRRSMIPLLVSLSLALLLVVGWGQLGYSLPAPALVKKPLPLVRPGYVYIMPWEVVILTAADLAPLLENGHERWEAQLAGLRAALERYHLQEAADRLWKITRREVLRLVGQPFPSPEEALKAANSLLDGLITSGIAILKQLIRKAQARAD